MGAAHEIDQGHRIGRVLIAAPRQVPVRSHEDELVRIKCCRIGGIDVEDDERDAAPREKGGCGLPRRAADMKNPACDAATRATGARTWTY